MLNSDFSYNTLRALLAGVAFIATVYLVRQKKVDEKFAGIWIISTVIAVVLAIRPSILIHISDFLGIQYPSNFILVFGIAFATYMVTLLAIEVHSLKNKIEKLAIEIALSKLD